MGDRQGAQKLLAQGHESVRDPARQDHAYQQFSSACYADPTFGEAFYTNGNNANDLKRPHAAIAMYRRAMECELSQGDRLKTLNNLAWNLQQVGRTHEAIDLLHQALNLDPTAALPYMTLGLCHTTLNQMALALGYAKKCFDLANQNDPASMANAEFQYAFALLHSGHYAAGLKHFESRFPARLPNFMAYPYPKWKGENGKVLFLVADQGLGDTLSYARLVEKAASRCRFIHMCTQGELRRVFEHAFRHLDNIAFHPSPSNFPGDADAWSTYVSLPYALGLTNDEIKQAPNIDVPRYPMPTQWKVPDRKFHIGIAWAGSPLNDIDAHRNIPIHHFTELQRVPGVQLYALQVDGKRADLNLWGFAPFVKDIAGYLRDVADTYSVLPHLDLVITVESALGHICTMGDHEHWVPYSRLGLDYRAGPTGEAHLWAPKARFFQQGADMRWEPVFERIVEALREKVDAVRS